MDIFTLSEVISEQQHKVDEIIRPYLEAILKIKDGELYIDSETYTQVEQELEKLTYLKELLFKKSFSSQLIKHKRLEYITQAGTVVIKPKEG